MAEQLRSHSEALQSHLRYFRVAAAHAHVDAASHSERGAASDTSERTLAPRMTSAAPRRRSASTV
jgi:hypothetical protein